MRRFSLIAAVALSSLIASAQGDLRGIWQVSSTANVDLEGHPAGAGYKASVSFVVEPENGKIPYRPEALEQVKRNAENRAKLDPVNACFQPGVPRATYIPEPLQIFQADDRVHIVYQHVHAYRVVFTDGSEHYDEGIEFYMGDSRGHWEGDTLVVDVTNFKPETWLDSAGHFHSEKLHVVERYTRTGEDTMLYEATLEDPEVFFRPWKIRMELARHTEANFQLVEHECERDASGAFHHPAEFSR